MATQKVFSEPILKICKFYHFSHAEQTHLILSSDRHKVLRVLDIIMILKIPKMLSL